MFGQDDGNRDDDGTWANCKERLLSGITIFFLRWKRKKTRFFFIGEIREGGCGLGISIFFVIKKGVICLLLRVDDEPSAAGQTVIKKGGGGRGKEGGRTK